LLTRTAALNAATKAELGRLEPQRIVVVGGPTIVSAAVENAAKAYAPQVVRRYGSDRFRTAVEVSRDYLPVLGAEAAVLATGFQFPDALAAGPVAAATGVPLLHVNGGPPHPAHEEIIRIDPARMVLAGGGAHCRPQSEVPSRRCSQVRSSRRRVLPGPRPNRRRPCLRTCGSCRSRRHRPTSLTATRRIRDDRTAVAGGSPLTQTGP
jgi:ell wall binding domain 2 (CWB2)